MNKLLKFATFIIAGLIVFAVAVVLVLFTVIDPNRYRSTLETLVARQTGLQLTIAGDMGWTFRPVFGLSIADVRLSNPDSPQELASFSTVALRLAPMDLLRGQLNMEELFTENLHVNWIVDAQGNSNWPLGNEEAPAPTADVQGSNDIPISLNIAQITVRNASFLIQDQQNGINTSLQNIDISSRNTNLDNRPFPLSLSMQLLDYSGGGNLELSLETTAAVDFNAGNLRLDDLQFNMSPLNLSGSVNVNDFMNELSWQAQLSSNTFALPHLLANFVATDERQLPPPNQQQLHIQQLQAAGTLSNVRLHQLDLGLGGNESLSLQGDVTLAQDNTPMRVNYTLRSDGIDLDRWMPPSEQAEPAAANNPAETATPTASTAPTDTELPLELLNSMNVRGTHDIGRFTAAGVTLSPLQFDLVLNDGQLNVDTRDVGFYDGQLDISTRLNARSNPAALTLITGLNNINAGTLAADMPALRFFDGRLDLNTSHRMSGNTVNALLNTITGSSQLQLRDSTVDITLLKEVFSAISVLSPRGDIASQWPDRVQISNTQAQLNFNNGLAADQELSLRLDNFDIAGTGGLDLQNSRFDYRMAFTILGEPAPQTLAVNEDFQNISWPIRCDAAFSDSALRYCSPDLQRVRELFAQLVRDEVERRATEAVGEQIDRVRDRLRDLFQ